jgi:DNA repair protein RadC
MQSTYKVSEITVSYRPAIGRKPKIVTALDAFTELLSFYSEDTIHLQESFMVMYLNRANRVIGVFKVSTGGITGTVADPRIILGTALKVAATSLVLSHNHPSCNLQPSRQDIELTSKIKEAGKYFDIHVLDHIILSPDRTYLSFADEGLL